MHPRSRPLKHLFLALALLIAFFAALAPTLPWVEFSNSMENLNVATVLEMHRDGQWLVPTLEGRPRIEKPPLTAWVTAPAVRSSTLAHLDDADRSSRDAAYARLAFDIRWTAVLVSCLTLLATYALALTIGDSKTALIAVAVCATNYFFLRFARFATTDVQLMLWVTLANVFIARIVLHGATWRNCIGAGVALGLAFMSKGPVSLVQSVIPALVFVGVRAARKDRSDRKISWLPIVAGIIVMLIIGLWWFVLVAQRDPGVISKWVSETNPVGSDRMSSSNVLVYGVIFAFMVPWIGFLIDGCVRALRNMTSQAAYPVVLLIVALLVMSCFADREVRYILPLVPIASVIAAQSVAAALSRPKPALLEAEHWLVLGLLALVPLTGGSTRFVRSFDGTPWFSPTFAFSAGFATVILVFIGFIASARWRHSLIVTSVVLMLVLQAVGIRGYARSREGRSELRELANAIRDRHADAEVFNWRSDGQQKRAPVDLPIYLNRPTRWTSDPAAIPPSDRAQIYVTLQQEGEPEPSPAPGWTYVHKVKRDKDWYVAFARPANRN